MPTIIDGVTFYSEEEFFARTDKKIREDAIRISARYRKEHLSNSVV
jgi:hypothetical protein